MKRNGLFLTLFFLISCSSYQRVIENIDNREAKKNFDLAVKYQDRGLLDSALYFYDPRTPVRSKVSIIRVGSVGDEGVK